MRTQIFLGACLLGMDKITPIFRYFFYSHIFLKNTNNVTKISFIKKTFNIAQRNKNYQNNNKSFIKYSMFL